MLYVQLAAVLIFRMENLLVSYFIPIFQQFFTPLGIGLLLSACGDVALELGSDGDKNLFLIGLVFFLFGHLFYVHAFYGGCHQLSLSSIAFPVAYYFAIIGKLWPHILTKEGNITDLTIPVCIYGVIISTMLASALTRAFSYNLGISNKSRLYAVIGASFFISSDTILAVDKFVGSFPHAKTYIMITYYIGQMYIAASAWYYDCAEKN